MSYSGGSEIVAIAADNFINLYTYCQNGMSSAYQYSFDANGQIVLPEKPYGRVVGGLITNISTWGGSSNTFATATKALYDSKKTTIPHNALVSFYSGANGNGSLVTGYFLNGYDSTPYGGFYVCNYTNAYYIGISNGTYTQYAITKTASSSRRVKENILPMTKTEAEKIYNLEVISFDYKKGYEEGKKNQFGLIAEDCDKVIPYAVYKPDDKPDTIWGIDYVKFVPYLIKTVQLQNERISQLESETKQLKK